MDKWIVFAFVSMLFAGMTSVIAKMGMAGISAELSLAVRTCFVSVFVLGFAARRGAATGDVRPRRAQRALARAAQQPAAL